MVIGGARRLSFQDLAAEPSAAFTAGSAYESILVLEFIFRLYSLCFCMMVATMDISAIALFHSFPPSKGQFMLIDSVILLYKLYNKKNSDIRQYLTIIYHIVMIIIPTNLVGIKRSTMIFSTRSSYGLRAMINLAKRGMLGSVSLAIIAKEEKISLKYLERLFANLKKAGLVKAEIGAGGGYKLARPAKQINIYDIITALEGKLSPFHCTGNKKKIYCGKLCDCGVTQVLSKVEQAITKSMKDIKLNQLL